MATMDVAVPAVTRESVSVVVLPPRGTSSIVPPKPATHGRSALNTTALFLLFGVVLLSLTAVAGYSYGSYATQADSVDLLSAETQIGSVRMASSSRRSSSSSSSSSRRSSAYGTPTNSYGSSSSYGSYGTYGTYGSYGSSRSRRSSSVILVGGVSGHHDDDDDDGYSSYGTRSYSASRTTSLAGNSNQFCAQTAYSYNQAACNAQSCCNWNIGGTTSSGQYSVAGCQSVVGAGRPCPGCRGHCLTHCHCLSLPLPMPATALCFHCLPDCAPPAFLKTVSSAALRPSYNNAGRRSAATSPTATWLAAAAGLVAVFVL